MPSIRILLHRSNARVKAIADSGNLICNPCTRLSAQAICDEVLVYFETAFEFSLARKQLRNPYVMEDSSGVNFSYEINW